MSDNNDFNLDDILSEFQDVPQGDGEELSGELDELLGSWLTDVPDADSDTDDSVPMDTIRLNELIGQLSDMETVTESVPTAPEDVSAADAEEIAPVVSPESTAAEMPSPQGQG